MQTHCGEVHEANNKKHSVNICKSPSLPKLVKAGGGTRSPASEIVGRFLHSHLKCRKGSTAAHKNEWMRKPLGDATSTVNKTNPEFSRNS